MIQKGKIPKQANFVTLNPRIKASDKIQVPSQTQSWTASRRVALVNNYGAAGSNAAIVLRNYQEPHASAEIPALKTYPIVMSAKSAGSLQSYVEGLKNFISTANVSLSDVAYSLAKRHNPSFEYRTAFTTKDTAGLVSNLERLSAEELAVKRDTKRSVVLAFGGQTGRTVIVSKDLYDTNQIFRSHLVR